MDLLAPQSSFSWFGVFDKSFLSFSVSTFHVRHVWEAGATPLFFDTNKVFSRGF